LLQGVDVEKAASFGTIRDVIEKQTRFDFLNANSRLVRRVKTQCIRADIILTAHVF
jgi:hypothetical protein